MSAYIKVYSSNPGVKDIIHNELVRRSLIYQKRQQDSKFKGKIFKTATLAVVAGILGIAIPFVSKDSVKKEKVKMDFSTIEKLVDGRNTIIDIINTDEELESKIEEFNTEEITNKENDTKPNIAIKSNVTETLIPGDVIEFERAYVAHYKHSDEYGGSWVVGSENEAINDVQWCFAMHREVGNYGYVDMSFIEEYKPYIAKNACLIYKSNFNKPFDTRMDCEQGSVIYLNDTDSIIDADGNVLYKVLIQNPINDENHPKYDYFVGYTDLSQIEKSNKEFSLGLVKQRTVVRSSPELIGYENLLETKNENFGLKYIVDISSYSQELFPDYIDTLNELNKKGILGGVIMEIARSESGDSFNIGCLKGNTQLDKKFSIIDTKFKEPVISSMGDYEQFKKYVEETSKICPVGYYVYTDVLNQGEVSGLANVVAETEKQLKSDISGYDDIQKLPLVIDVEKGKDEDREIRTKETIQLINLLGHGTNERYYWTLDEGRAGAKEGLNVIDDQYMLYTMPSNVAAKKERQSSGHQITCIEDIQNGTPDYTLINFGALYVDGILSKGSNSEEYQKLLNPEELVKKMYSDGKYSNPSNFSFYNVEEADLMQCMGNINQESVEKLKLKRQLIDISVCPTDTYNAILNGTFKGHEGTFLGNITKAIEKYKNNSNTLTSKENCNVKIEEYDRD